MKILYRYAHSLIKLKSFKVPLIIETFHPASAADTLSELITSMLILAALAYLGSQKLYTL